MSVFRFRRESEGNESNFNKYLITLNKRVSLFRICIFLYIVTLLSLSPLSPPSRDNSAESETDDDKQEQFRFS